MTLTLEVGTLVFDETCRLVMVEICAISFFVFIVVFSMLWLMAILLFINIYQLIIIALCGVIYLFESDNFSVNKLFPVDDRWSLWCEAKYHVGSDFFVVYKYFSIDDHCLLWC
jgi:hypothetical protein